MTFTVELGAVEGFTLDDPVRGVLDNVNHTLGGVTFAAITDYVVDATISRGKNRDLQRFQAGRATIELVNQNREFDPEYSGATFQSRIEPRAPIRLSWMGERIFTGIVSDWDLTYNVTGQSRATVTALDEMTLLALQDTVEEVATTQYSGERVAAILDQESVNWPADRRNIDVGESILGTDTISGDVLSYLQKVEQSEQGQLFIARNGDLQFRSRLDATPTSGTYLTLGDDDTGIPYSEIAINYGTELLFNRVTVSSAAGTTIANNTPSQLRYGISELNLETLVNSAAQVTNLADYLVQRYGEPEYRPEAVKISIDRLPTADKNDLAALEIGDVVLLKFTPNGIGSAVSLFNQVIRIDHDVQTDRHDMIIGLQSLEWNFLVLDDAEFGIIGTGRLAF